MSAGAIRMLAAWGTLMLLLALTLGAAFLPLGAFKPLAGYAIATVKAGVILWVFMEMRREGGLPRLAAIAGFIWLALLFTLTAADYLTRGWIS